MSCATPAHQLLQCRTMVTIQLAPDWCRPPRHGRHGGRPQRRAAIGRHIPARSLGGGRTAISQSSLTPLTSSSNGIKHLPPNHLLRPPHEISFATATSMVGSKAFSGQESGATAIQLPAGHCCTVRLLAEPLPLCHGRESVALPLGWPTTSSTMCMQCHGHHQLTIRLCHQPAPRHDDDGDTTRRVCVHGQMVSVIVMSACRHQLQLKHCWTRSLLVDQRPATVGCVPPLPSPRPVMLASRPASDRFQGPSSISRALSAHQNQCHDHCRGLLQTAHQRSSPKSHQVDHDVVWSVHTTTAVCSPLGAHSHNRYRQIHIYTFPTRPSELLCRRPSTTLHGSSNPPRSSGWIP